MLNPETTEEKQNKCCTDLDYEYGDAVEWEVWSCDKCNNSYLVDIEIVRDFKNMKQVKW